MSNELPEIVRRAMVETSRGKGGPFPILKTVYAHRDFDFGVDRQRYIDEAMAAYEIEKRLRASGYFDVNSPNYGVDLAEQSREDEE